MRLAPNMKRHALLCIILHLILALIYIIVLALTKARVFDNALHLSEDTARTVVTFITQSFTIAYCAGLVFFTQRVALHEIVDGRQTLTAMHDKSSAWLGFLSSLSVLFHQKTDVTDFIGISIIASYLLCILAVHTTLPGSFSVSALNTTIYKGYPTILAHQNFGEIYTNGFPSANPPLSILSIYDFLNITTIGLWDNMIYDIIPVVNDATNADVAVNATTISAKCSPITEAFQSNFYANGTIYNNGFLDGPVWEMTFGGGAYTASFGPVVDDYIKVVGPIVKTSMLGDYWLSPSMVTVVATSSTSIGISDLSNGMQVVNTLISINPPWVPDLSYESPVTSVHVIGCNFAAHNSTVNVNAQTREVTKRPAIIPPVAWHNWTDPGISSDSLLMESLAYFAADSSSDQMTMNPALDPGYFNIMVNATVNITTQSHLSTLDSFMYTDSSGNGGYSGYTFAGIEQSLVKAYTAMLWYTTVTNPAPGFEKNVQLQGEALIPVPALQVRIVINIVSLTIGLATSCILLVLALVFVFRARASQQDSLPIDSTGLLPMLWLLGNEPRLADIQEPTLDALRTAGMYEVSSSGARRCARFPGTGTGEMGESSGQHAVYFPLTPHERDQLSSVSGSVDKL